MAEPLHEPLEGRLGPQTGALWRRYSHYAARAAECWKDYLDKLPADLRRQLTEVQVAEADKAGKVKRCRTITGPRDDWEW